MIEATYEACGRKATLTDETLLRPRGCRGTLDGVTGAVLCVGLLVLTGLWVTTPAAVG